MFPYTCDEVHSTNHCALRHLLAGDQNYRFDSSASGVVLRQQFVFLILWALYYTCIFLLLCGVLSWCVFVAYDVPFDCLSDAQCV
jgi:hypothetical protein